MTTRSGTSGKRGDVFIGLHAKNARPLRIHRIDRAAERRAQHVPEHGASYAAFTIGGADDGDAARIKNIVESMPL